VRGVGSHVSRNYEKYDAYGVSGLKEGCRRTRGDSKLTQSSQKGGTPDGTTGPFRWNLLTRGKDRGGERESKSDKHGGQSRAGRGTAEIAEGKEVERDGGKSYGGFQGLS